MTPSHTTAVTAATDIQQVIYTVAFAVTSERECFGGQSREINNDGRENKEELDGMENDRDGIKPLAIAVELLPTSPPLSPHDRIQF